MACLKGARFAVKSLPATWRRKGLNGRDQSAASFYLTRILSRAALWFTRSSSPFVNCVKRSESYALVISPSAATSVIDIFCRPLGREQEETRLQLPGAFLAQRAGCAV